MLTKDAAALLPTLSEEELAATLAVSPETLADFAATVAHNPRSTIEPTRARSSAAGRRALAGLGGAHAGVAGGLDMGETIGEGGMGIVRSAMQRALGRRVAVKTLRPTARSEEATLRLLREAWITGALEHPNIVPVYDLGLGDDGTPIIVLKHIEGAPWSAFMADAASIKARFGAGDPLEHNLRILVQLCNAVSLAHSRGVLHRDLKPENVMVGRFGEVYLVDWGIAVSLRDDPTGRLPLASDALEMAGTPSYMAPEMLGGMGRLDERTDVYLLGAILFEILAGRPPHVGEGFRQIVVSILLSKPVFPDGAPEALAAIAARAMSPAAEERFASAEELRQKLEWYLRHRGSLALSAEAALRVDEMRAVLATEGPSHAAEPTPRRRGGPPEDVRDRVHHLFAEARFGFRQAIRACDDNEAARAGLREVTEMVVVFELERGTPEAAAAALAELDDPPRALVKRVGDAMRARELEKQRVAELEKLSADLDPATGRRTRMGAMLMMCVVWTVSPEVLGWMYRRSPEFPHWIVYAFTVCMTAIGAVVLLWGRESLSKTVVNRRSQAALMMMAASQLTLELGGHLHGIAMPALLVLHVFCWFCCVVAFTLFIDRRFWSSVAGFLVAFLVACAWPGLVWHAMTFTTLVLSVNALVAWSRPAEDTDYFAERVRERFTGVGSRLGR